MLVIFMVITSSSKKTQASCLRTEIVTQKKAFAPFLFKRVFIFIRLVRFGHLYGRLRYVAALSILFPYVNFLTQSVFLAKLKRIIIIATLNGPI